MAQLTLLELNNFIVDGDLNWLEDNKEIDLELIEKMFNEGWKMNNCKKWIKSYSFSLSGEHEILLICEHDYNLD